MVPLEVNPLEVGCNFYKYLCTLIVDYYIILQFFYYYVRFCYLLGKVVLWLITCFVKATIQTTQISIFKLPIHAQKLCH